MLSKIIASSLKNKVVVMLFVLAIIGFGVYSLLTIKLGSVPDITNNQVQVITTSQNLSTEDIEKFITYPVELSMANLPGVKEMRSISKFGISVVTVVFEDDMGTYLPRQLIAEKLKQAEEIIPPGFGVPFMGPVTTGLGEIYQYTVEVEDKYKDKYSLEDLRSIQDWVIRRQLSGIPGVVEVNAWGGKLKQYEVAIDPMKLRSMDVDLFHVVKAIESNNDVASGAYLEKNKESYFIRAEGLITSLSDIENIVIEKRSGLPLLLKDIAKVQYGNANRYGAITGNGEGEKVMGQIMMLKGENTGKVIKDVKLRLKEMEKSLPPGVYINGFLDRSVLIDKTTATIAENLIFGCLIVVFVVLLILGNLRSGLIVASIIPLSLLFALSLMKVFDVDANLMSLGAIDFGIIIDGAVIIVEYVAFQVSSKSLTLQSLSKDLRREEMMKISENASSKMMKSAIFGQLIIIIVFIPILSLSGVEGKMFKPMAMVFCFALIGAMILCLTYIPVMAALFLKSDESKKVNFSDKLILWINKIYEPSIRLAMQWRKSVIGLSLILLLSSIWVFSKMGAEFVPTLDEGDFVIQPVLKTGTSLSETVNTMTKIENILLGFPEVEQVITRIGAAEVPTDPMSMEECDVIIKLRPKDEWTTADNKDDLSNAFKEALYILPGIDYEFTQPIEMRFNELITGVRADVAIKIFGEDLDVLQKKGLEIAELIKDVQGAADITVDKLIGLPQVKISYNRDVLAKYGLNIEDINNVISLGFAGEKMGIVYEGEKQYDLVIRFDSESRNSLEFINKTPIKVADEQFIPLSEIANIEISNGPANISRDDTKRRLVVGINVRNRDIQSVVDEVSALIESNIELPVGYNIHYGGQFENLKNAEQRLIIAVPIALLLIFIMLYFAFSSVNEALMIFSAIPLAAIGGIYLLFLRALPFSISAGVGFIALFGIAVLNGIVLIEHFNSLKEKGMDDVFERVILGTKQRLRPVLLTAAAAALGFLPMAISGSSGAEVQRPLASVVIGGLISSTFLTLIVLPVLYTYFDKKIKISKTAGLVVLILFSIIPFSSNAQIEISSPEQAYELALENNSSLKSSQLNIDQAKTEKGKSMSLGKTEFFYNYDENNIAENGSAINVYGIGQGFSFPGKYLSQSSFYKTKVAQQEQLNAHKNLKAKKDIYLIYNQLNYLKNEMKLYEDLVKIYSEFERSSEKKFQLGDNNFLEKLTAQSKKQEADLKLSQTKWRYQEVYQELKANIQVEDTLTISFSAFAAIDVKMPEMNTNPGIKYYEASILMSQKQVNIEKQGLLPDFNIRYFQGSNRLPNAKTYQGIELGVSIPLWFKPQQTEIKQNLIIKDQLEYDKLNYSYQLESNLRKLKAKLERNRESLSYYENQGNQLANELIRNTKKAFESGEIDYFENVRVLDQAYSLKLNRIKSIYDFNQTAIEIIYLTE